MSIFLQSSVDQLSELDIENAEMGYFVLAILFIVAAIFYFLPSILALLRGKNNTIAIMALNLFLGWTLVGWVVALVWSLSSDAKPAQVIVKQQSNKKDDEMDKLHKLKKLLDEGTITQEEFVLQKKKILGN